MKILGITQIFDPAYAIAIAIATAFQATLQATITHHGTMLNNLNPIPILVNLYPKKPINATANIPPTIDALAFTNLVGEFFWVFDLEFLVKSFEKNFTSRNQPKCNQSIYDYMRLIVVCD